MEGGGSGGTGDTWAGRWELNNLPTNAQIMLAFWLGGQNSVTARAQATVSADGDDVTVPVGISLVTPRTYC